MDDIGLARFWKAIQDICEGSIKTAADLETLFYMEIGKRICRSRKKTENDGRKYIEAVYVKEFPNRCHVETCVQWVEGPYFGVKKLTINVRAGKHEAEE